MKKIAFIPARGGSKSISLKNIKYFCNKPLIYWSLKSIVDSPIDEVYVATDSSEIRDVVLSFKFKKVKIFHRNPTNAQDTSSTESVILEFLKKSQFLYNDIFILVQATFPFTQPADFVNAIDHYLNNKYDSLLTCYRDKRFFWNDDGIPMNYQFTNRPRRQDFKGQLTENGAFYINRIGNIQKHKNRLSGRIGIYEMASCFNIEIDEEPDWMLAESLMEKYIFSTESFNGKQNVKLFLSDVDGVLTDSGMYYTEEGDELKKFNTRDGVGFELLRNEGIKTGIITSEDTTIVETRAKKMQLDFIFQGVQNKLEVTLDLCDKIGISIKNVAYIGDDINDIELLKEVGVKACPSDAESQIKDIPGIFILNSLGGRGAIREFANRILKNHQGELSYD